MSRFRWGSKDEQEDFRSTGLRTGTWFPYGGS